jgi:rSAM/selenodomain-associated transferase 1
MMTDSLLIVFAKAPVAGRVKTRLAAGIGAAAAAGIYRALAEEAWTAARAAAATLPCALWLYAEPPEGTLDLQDWLPGADAYVPQPAGDLGVRITEAFRLGFEAGFRKVAILGTDIPGLSVAQLRLAFAACDDHGASAGPTEDGGFYLLALGARRDALFQDVPWSATTTLARIRDRTLRRGLAWTELDVLRDIDTPEDWAWFRGTPAGAALAARLEG